VGQESQYEGVSGFWIGTTSWAYISYRFRLTTRITAVEDNRISVSGTLKTTAEIFYGREKPIGPDQGQFEWSASYDINGAPIADASKVRTLPMPFGRVSSILSPELAGIQYPKEPMWPKESWSREFRYPFNDTCSVVGFVIYTFEGMEQLDGQMCVRIGFEGHSVGGRQKVGIAGTYWLDASNGGIVKLEVGEPQPADKISLDPSQNGFRREWNEMLRLKLVNRFHNSRSVPELWKKSPPNIQRKR
jgi:hypothetical protein